jgi:hypothetical protein
MADGELTHTMPGIFLTVSFAIRTYTLHHIPCMTLPTWNPTSCQVEEKDRAL